MLITKIFSTLINIVYFLKTQMSMISISDEPEKKSPADGKPSLFTVMKSVLAAMVGVQSDENRERDFKTGSASDYIIVGIIFIVIFIITLMMVVSSVIENS